MIPILNFLEVILKGMEFTGFALSSGGIIVVLMVLRPEGVESVIFNRAVPFTMLWITAGWMLITFSLALMILIQFATTAADFGTSAVLGFFTARIGGTTLLQLAVAAFSTGAAVSFLKRDLSSRAGWKIMVACAIVFSAAGSFLVHGATRIEGRKVLMSITVLHQISASIWSGGVIHIVILWRLLKRHTELIEAWQRVLARFSPIAVFAMAVIVTSGAFLATRYLGGWEALAGTPYGSVFLTKGAIISVALLFGGKKFILIRRLLRGAGNTRSEGVLLPFFNSEAMICIVLLFASASLSLLPPAIDILPHPAAMREEQQVLHHKPHRLVHSLVRR